MNQPGIEMLYMLSTYQVKNIITFKSKFPILMALIVDSYPTVI